MSLLEGAPLPPVTNGGHTIDEPDIATLLRYGTDLHTEVLNRVVSRVDLASRHIATRYDEWDRVDEHCRLFLDLSRKARKGDKTEDSKKREMPFDRSIVIPMSLSVLLVRLTQLMAIFTNRTPLIQLEGRGPE